MTCMVTLKNKNPCAEGNEIYNFGTPYFGHKYFMLSLVITIICTYCLIDA